MGARQSTLQVTFTVDGDGKVKAALNGVAADADKSGKSIDNLSKELKALNERVDQHAAKTNQLARDRAVLDASLSKGIITQREYNTLLGKSAIAYDSLITKARLFGAALGTFVAGGLVEIFKATIDAEKVQAQLASGIADTAGAANRSLPQLNALADALRHATTFSSDEIGSVEQVLLTFRNIKDINFDKATASVLDLSTKLGIDLRSASIEVGKALEDPVKGVTALSRAGVQFSVDQRKVIKALVDTGDVAGAQRIILKELEDEMGTAAEAARNTLGGALKGLENSFHELLVGDASGEGIQGTTAAINELAGTMDDPDVKAGFQSMIQGLASVAEFAAKGISALANFGRAIDDAISKDSDKSYIGLLHKRADLEDDLGAATDGGVLNRLSLATGGKSNTVNPLSTNAAAKQALQAQIAAIDKQLSDRRAALQQEDADATLAAFSDSLGNTAGGTGTGTGKPTKPGRTSGGRGDSGAAAHRAAAEAARQQAEAEKALQAQLDSVSTAQGEFSTKVQDLQAELDGPMAQAQLAYNRKLEDTRALAKKGEISATDLAKAEALLGQEFAKETEELKRRQDPAGELIKQLDEELRLRTLNNAEAQAAIDLSHLAVPATKDEAAAILQRYQALQKQQDAADAMDAFRETSKSAFSAFIKGEESAGDAAKDFFGNLADRLLELAENEIWRNLFGEQGSAGGGSAGGWLSQLFGGGGGQSSGGGWLSSLFGGGSGNSSLSEDQLYAKSVSGGGITGGQSIGGGGGFWGEIGGLFSSLFGGGKASGGDVQSGRFYKVNEDRPELLSVGGSTWLMMGGQGGHVHANRGGDAGQSGGNVFNINVPVEGRVDRRTRSHIAHDTAFELQRVQRSFGR